MSYPPPISGNHRSADEISLCHVFTKIHGAYGYLNDSFFSNKEKHKEIIDKAEQQKNARLQHEAYLKHFVTDLKQDIPLWAYVDLLTIADISFLNPDTKLLTALYSKSDDLQ